jgi:hypothetical protein
VEAASTSSDTAVAPYSPPFFVVAIVLTRLKS